MVHKHTPRGANASIYFDTAGCCDGSASRISGPIAGTSNGEWIHFAFVKDGNRKQVWQNGQLLFSGTNTAALPSDFSQLFLGSAPGGQYSINGILDDFAIFSEALSDNQIVALANGATPTSIHADHGTVYELTEHGSSASPEVTHDTPSDGFLRMTQNGRKSIKHDRICGDARR